MNRLTSERVNGIKRGYWSPNTKEEIVQRLAAYENTGLDPEEIAELLIRMSDGDVPKVKRIGNRFSFETIGERCDND